MMQAIYGSVYNYSKFNNKFMNLVAAFKTKNADSKYLNSISSYVSQDSDLDALLSMRKQLIEIKTSPLAKLEYNIRKIIKTDYILMYNKTYDSSLFPQIVLKNSTYAMVDKDSIEECIIYLGRNDEALLTPKQISRFYKSDDFYGFDKFSVLDEVRHFNTFKNLLENKSITNPHIQARGTLNYQHKILYALYGLLFPEESGDEKVDLTDIQQGQKIIESSPFISVKTYFERIKPHFL